MLKTNAFSVTFESRVDVETIAIDSKYSIFKAIFKTIKNGVVQELNEQTGVALNTNIEKGAESGQLISTNNNILILDDKMRHALRTYGFPNYCERDEIHLDEKTVVQPQVEFLVLFEDNKVTFDDVKSNPELLDEIVWIDFSNLFVQKMVSLEYINIALFTEWLAISNQHLKSFSDEIIDLFKNNRLSAKMQHNGDLTYWLTGSGYHVNARVRFTDEEFVALVEEEKRIRESKKLNKEHCSNYHFAFLQEAFLNLDFLDVCKDFWGYETKSPYLTRDDFEKDHDDDENYC